MTLSLGLSLTDTLDDLINEGRIEPQLAMKILSTFDKIVTEVLADKVRARLTFKVRAGSFGSWIPPSVEELLRYGQAFWHCFNETDLLFQFPGPPRYLSILRRSLDLLDQRRILQVG